MSDDEGAVDTAGGGAAAGDPAGGAGLNMEDAFNDDPMDMASQRDLNEQMVRRQVVGSSAVACAGAANDRCQLLFGVAGCRRRSFTSDYWGTHL
jgi:hypothetical protein